VRVEQLNYVTLDVCHFMMSYEVRYNVFEVRYNVLEDFNFIH
jgi:hypothetical protein